MTQRTRGRPQIHQFEARRDFAESIRAIGIRQTREASKLSVSLSTLIKIAREFGIQLKKGRRPQKAA